MKKPADLLCFSVIIKELGHGIFKKISTVKPVLRGRLKIDITKVLMGNGSLMKVECIAECSKGSILQYF